MGQRSFLPFWLRLAERVVPSAQLGNDPERVRRARLVLAFAAMTGLSVSILGVFQIFFGSPLIALVVAAGPAVAAAVVLVLRATRSEVLAANFLAFCWMAGITAVVVIRGGFGPPIVMTYGVVPMLAFVLASRRSGRAWLAVCVVVMLGIGGYQSFIRPLPVVDLSSPVPLNMVGHITFVVACYGFGALFEFFRRRALDDLAAAQTKLMEAERRRLESEAEARVLRSSRMAELGTLAAGVAHEINNPLTYVSGNVDHLLDEGASVEPSEVKELLEETREGAKRISKIVRDISLFSRVEDDDTRDPVDVHQVIDSAVSLLWNQVRHRAELHKSYGEVPEVLASGSRLGQVFVNLVLNAAQAIPEERTGRIEVRTSLTTEGTVRVDVVDDGPGMSRELQRRALEPFFTTKPVGEGTGLGLSICYGIVAGLGGELHIDSEEGRGTTVSVELPAASRATAADGEAPRAPTEEDGNGALRVLVVDDDPLVLRSIARMLADERVTTVGSGPRALEMLRDDPDQFDVVLCDLMMPELTGMDVYERAGRLGHDLQSSFVFMTGGAFTGRARAFVDRVPATTLDKPLCREGLLAALRSVAR